jgi:hypothetical protein
MITPRVELFHSYVSKEFGMFLVRQFSVHQTLITIITSYGEVKRAGYSRFDGLLHPDFECIEIDQKIFINDYKRHVKDTDLVFLFNSSTVAEKIEGGSRTVRCVCQETKSHYCY